MRQDSATPGDEDYGIIEFQGPTTSDQQGPSYQPNGGQAGFYGWNNANGSFDFIGLPSGFVYNSWVQLTIALVPGQHFVYTVSSPLTSLSLNSPFSYSDDAYLENVILQGYNYGSDYNIFWGGGTLGGLIPEDFLLYFFYST